MFQDQNLTEIIVWLAVAAMLWAAIWVMWMGG